MLKNMGDALQLQIYEDYLENIAVGDIFLVKELLTLKILELYQMDISLRTGICTYAWFCAPQNLPCAYLITGCSALTAARGWPCVSGCHLQRC